MTDPLRPARRTFRAWRNRRRLEKEAAWYRRRFAERGLSIPDPGGPGIRNAIAERVPGLAPLPKGSLGIVAVYHHYNWENDSLRPALEKFGRVFHYDWGDRYDHSRKGWHASLKGEMNRDLVATVAGRARTAPVHVVFAYLSGENVSPETLESLAALRVPLVNLALNDKEGFVGKVRGGLAMGARDICRHFDLCWTSTRDALEKYCVEGATPVYLPEGANPEVHRPCDVPREFDVSFVGQCYGNRPAVVEALRKAGIRVETFGPGWPNGPLSTEEMVKMYSRSRINLGFGGVAGHRETFCLKGRDFEVPMSGGLYLTEHHEELSPFFEVGKEIVTYSGFDELLAKVRRLLSGPAEADAIRRAGRARALRDHTWEMRFETVFRLMGILA